VGEGRSPGEELGGARVLRVSGGQVVSWWPYQENEPTGGKKENSEASPSPSSNPLGSESPVLALRPVG
jgi:hypothetical protein